jgi:hypothetical protein
MNLLKAFAQFTILNTKVYITYSFTCHNPSLGLTNKAKGCKVVGQKEDLGGTSHVPGSAKSVRE